MVKLQFVIRTSLTCLGTCWILWSWHDGARMTSGPSCQHSCRPRGRMDHWFDLVCCCRRCCFIFFNSFMETWLDNWEDSTSIRTWLWIFKTLDLGLLGEIIYYLQSIKQETIPGVHSMTPWRAVQTQFRKGKQKASTESLHIRAPSAGLQNPSFSGRWLEMATGVWRQVSLPPSTFTSERGCLCHLTPLSLNFVLCEREIITSTY